MKRNQENLDTFIAEQKERFNKYLKSDAGFEWDEDWYSSNKIGSGFFSCNKISIKKVNNIFNMTEIADLGFHEKRYTLNDEFYSFMKAYAVARYFSNKNMKFRSLNAEFMFIKKLFILLGSTIENPRIANIKTTDLQKLTHSVATHSKSKQIRFALVNCVIPLSKILLEQGLTHVRVDVNEVVNYISMFKIEGQKSDFDAENVNELDGDDDVEMITIRTFLNITKLRGLVETVGQKVALNLLLLLIVTGFRGISEGARLKVDSLRRREVEDPKLHKQLTEKGLKTYYLGIYYHASKNGKDAWRTHWVEPLAIDLVEMIYEDTLRLTQPLRDSVIGFNNGDPLCFLPESLKSKVEISSVEIMESLKLKPFSKHYKPNGKLRALAFTRWQESSGSKGVRPSRIEKVNIDGHQGAVHHYSAYDANRLIAPYSHTEQQEQLIKDSFQVSDKHAGTLKIEDALFIVPQSDTNNAAYHVRENLSQLRPTYATIPNFLSQGEFERFIKGYPARNDRAAYPSVFEVYELLENEDGEYSKLRTHMPRHNVNTFLAIVGISDHLQAIMMGRKDTEQNKYYHHLAIEEKAKASSVVVYSKEIDFNRPTPDELNAGTTPLDAVKETAEMRLDEKLELDNKLKQMLGSSTTKHDKVEFMLDTVMIEEEEDEFSNGLFEAASELDTVGDKKSFLKTHGELTQLDFGACMRDVPRLGCPYSHRCQDGKPCPYFALTGRLDEPIKLKSKIDKNESNLQDLNALWASQGIPDEQYVELQAELGEISETLIELKQRSNLLEVRKTPVDLLEMDEHKKPKTLATLFALEHRQRNDDSRKLKDDVTGQVKGD